MSINGIVDEILRREGWPAYTNQPADRGGPTKGGITLASFRDYSEDQTLTADDLKDMTEAQARVFYMHRYVTEPRFHRIDDPILLELVVDCGVHHGTRAAAKWLQRAAGVRQDGDIGPITLATVNSVNAHTLFLQVLASRIRLFGRIIGRDPVLREAEQAGFNLQARWAGGWNNRAAEFLESLASRLATGEN